MRHIPIDDVNKEKFFKDLKDDALILLNPERLEYVKVNDEIHVWDTLKQKKYFEIRVNALFITVQRNWEFTKNAHVNYVYDIICKIIKDIAP